MSQIFNLLGSNVYDFQYQKILNFMNPSFDFDFNVS